jgi:hypothetical protein
MSEITIDLHNRRLDLLGAANSSGCTASAYARAAPEKRLGATSEQHNKPLFHGEIAHSSPPRAHTR